MIIFVFVYFFVVFCFKLFSRAFLKVPLQVNFLDDDILLCDQIVR
jgi:hypothetical protein